MHFSHNSAASKVFILATTSFLIPVFSLKEPKYVVLANRFLLRELPDAIANFSRLRDYHKTHSDRNKPYPDYPWLVVANTVAIAVNATLIECDVTTDCYPEQVPSHPRLTRSQSSTEGDTGSILSIWNCRGLANYGSSHWKRKFSREVSPNITSYPMFTLVGEQYLNFYYCDLPRKLKFSSWRFALFTDPFDKWTWIFIVFFFCIMKVILSITPNTCETRQSVSVMPLLSATMQIGTDHISRRSCVLILWMFLTMILVHFYCGEITGTLIRPLENDIITRIIDLYNRNFTLYMHHVSYSDRLNTTIQSMKPSSPKRKLIGSLSRGAILGDLGSMLNSFFMDKIFVFNDYLAALYLVQYGNDIIPREGKTDSDKARRCHLGQELLQVEENFFVTLPPYNEKLTRAFEKLFQAGIVQLFYQEHVALAITKRVQDRVKIIGRTNIKEANVNVVEKLKLKGKMTTVFLLWVTCVVLSLVVFCCENGLQSIKKVIRYYMHGLCGDSKWVGHLSI